MPDKDELGGTLPSVLERKSRLRQLRPGEELPFEPQGKLGVAGCETGADRRSDLTCFRTTGTSMSHPVEEKSE